MGVRSGKLKKNRKLLVLETDFWCRSARISRRKKVINEIIRENMNIKNKILDDICAKQLVWYGHVQRMDEEACLKSFN
jgi:hypothetical protein